MKEEKLYKKFWNTTTHQKCYCSKSYGFLKEWNLNRSKMNDCIKGRRKRPNGWQAEIDQPHPIKNNHYDIKTSEKLYEFTKHIHDLRISIANDICDGVADEGIYHKYDKIYSCKYLKYELNGLNFQYKKGILDPIKHIEQREGIEYPLTPSITCDFIDVDRDMIFLIKDVLHSELGKYFDKERFHITFEKKDPFTKFVRQIFIDHPDKLKVKMYIKYNQLSFVPCDIDGKGISNLTRNINHNIDFTEMLSKDDSIPADVDNSEIISDQQPTDEISYNLSTKENVNKILKNRTTHKHEHNSINKNIEKNECSISAVNQIGLSHDDIVNLLIDEIQSNVVNISRFEKFVNGQSLTNVDEALAEMAYSYKQVYQDRKITPTLLSQFVWSFYSEHS